MRVHSLHCHRHVQEPVWEVLHCDTPPGAQAPRLLLPLFCTREAEKCSVATTGASRSGGGIAEGASPSRRILSWAVPGPVALPCLSERERWPTTSVSGVLGTAHTRAFRRCSPGNVPQRRRLFPMLLFALPHAPSAVQPMVPCLRRSREQSTAVQHGRVFTGSPSLPNPYTMQLERDYMPLLFVCVISGNSRANTSTRLTPWVLHHRGLRRAEAPFCHH